VGESLVDFTPVVRDGRLDGFRVHPGGSPCNVAVGVARLGRSAAYAGRLSGDLFGRLLSDHLAANGVGTLVAAGRPPPTPLPLVAERDGEPAHAFPPEGTAAAPLNPADPPP